MIAAGSFADAGRAAGFEFYCGVPCSFLTPVINRVISDPGLTYVAAASEGEAVAIASGAWLAGRQAVVMCQNSGLGNAVNPLTSLNFPFRIPVLLIVTWRAGPGVKDEPQHELMGAITPDLIDLMQIRRQRFPVREADIASVLGEARAAMEADGLPFALIMEKGDVEDDDLGDVAYPERPQGVGEDLRAGAAPPARMVSMERLLAVVPDEAAVIATTGKCGRELFTIADREQHLYQVGSMGCAASMGLGVALNAERPVIVLDGDGAALMKMGTLATVGSYGPENLIHIVLDNGTYDSTGGQPTVSPSVDFAHVALACGYTNGFTCDSLDGFEGAVKAALGKPGPHLVHMRIRPGSTSGLGRPTITPPEVARRFKAFLAS